MLADVLEAHDQSKCLPISDSHTISLVDYIWACSWPLPPCQYANRHTSTNSVRLDWGAGGGEYSDFSIINLLYICVKNVDHPCHIVSMNSIGLDYIVALCD